MFKNKELSMSCNAQCLFQQLMVIIYNVRMTEVMRNAYVHDGVALLQCTELPHLHDMGLRHNTQTFT